MFNFGNIDISLIEFGNPGIGGTEYMYFLLGVNLLKRGYDVSYYVTDASKVTFYNRCICQKVQSFDACANLAVMEQRDFLIIRQEDVKDVLKLNNKSDIRIICWIHNFIPYEKQRLIAECDMIKCCVFVGRQQYDRYLDCDIINKSTYIYNFIDFSNVEYHQSIRKTKKVVYVGFLGYAKGFHEIAAVWPNIIRRVPDAELYVIGSGKIYDKNCIMGNRGIAEKKYEEYLFELLGPTKESVHFCGNLGIEKYEFMKNCLVGISNPTGKGETFCISAVEMEACGLPVITWDGNGLLDTISREAGIFIRNRKQLENAIVHLLEHDEIAVEMGRKGREYSEMMFSPNQNTEKWITLFDKIYNDEKILFMNPNNYLLRDKKVFRLISHYIRRIFHLSDRSCILHFEELLQYKRKSIFRKSK